VILGSERDKPIAEKSVDILKKLGITYEVKVLSAHRSPDELERYVKESKAKVFIGIAGLSAQLPGFIASRTTKPVIGVPVDVKLGGLDALLSMMQMPRGTPVATVGVDSGENAGWLAGRILALKNRRLQEKLTGKHGIHLT